MADAIEIILSAVDSASEVFQSVISSAQSMADGITGSIEGASSDFDTITENVSSFSEIVSSVDTSTLEELANQLGMDTDEVERLISAGADIGSMSAGFNEAAAAADELEKEIQEDTEAMEEFGSAGDVMAAQTFMDMATGLKDSMLGMADAAGTYSDSMMRAGLEAEGAGISAEEMSNIVSELSDTTGRAGGQIRESFIKATARGVTDMNSFKTMMEGAGAQATLLGTDIQTMGDKFSGMAQKDTLMARALAETGITMDELGVAMGMTGATADEVKAKWKELDTNQRAAILGQAASMNEGKTANQEYKTSWAGLQEQIEIARGRLERIVGAVILPVLVPAMKLAGDILNGVGDVIQGVMSGPLGGLVSILGTAAGVFMMAVAGAAALRNILGFLKIETMLETAATTMNTIAKEINEGASIGAAIGNQILSGGFMASAAAAWSAAAAFIAATWPLWVIVGAIIAVIAIIYELGKAFGWWTDVSSMIEAIQAGLQRLWNAFINHPDVQGAIAFISSAFQWLGSVITAAWSALMDFLGVSTGGEFDVVHEIIMAIGAAWNMITAPIRAVIGLVTSLVTIFSQLSSGQIDLQTAFMLVWNALLTFFQTMTQSIFFVVMQFAANLLSAAVQAGSNLLTGVITYVSRLPGRVYTYLLNVATRITAMGARWVAIARVKANLLVLGIITYLMQLPGKVFSALMGVVGRITGAIGHWINAAKNKVRDVINAITSPFSGVAGAISGALSGVANAIKAPFEAAWNAIEPLISKIQDGMKLVGAAGGEMAAGGETLDVNANRNFNISTGEYTIDDSPIVIEDNINLSLDLSGVPRGVNTNELVNAIQDRNVLNALVTNRDFQDLDAKVKQRINLKNVRARGR